MYCASRPLLETVVRQRLVELDGVEVRDDTQFAAYRSDASGDRIDGVRVRGDDELETLEAEVRRRRDRPDQSDTSLAGRARLRRATGGPGRDRHGLQHHPG